jgi:hypothetical protein
MIRKDNDKWTVHFFGEKPIKVRCLSEAKRIAIQCGASGLFTRTMDPTGERGKLLPTYRDSKAIGDE